MASSESISLSSGSRGTSEVVELL
ncbi:hypothetical protein A2U01_0056284, partial [Trifolium medium]|nr:hypothetical protein [Trifolium medium]